MTRLLALVASVSATAWAQFYSLATPADGSAVYFTTSLRLKGTFEPLSGKVFRADQNGVRLAVGRELRPLSLPVNYSGNCVLGKLYTFAGVELSSDGATLAAQGRDWTAGQCHGAGAATLLRRPTGTRDVNGTLRISANGRWAVVDTAFSVFSQATVSIRDLQTGASADFTLPTIGGVQFAAGRTIADNGTAVLIEAGRAYLAKPDGTQQPFPNGYPLAISANGNRILYLTDSAHLIDLPTGQDEQLGAVGQSGTTGWLSDDGNRTVFVQNQQLWVADFGGGGARQVSSEPDGVVSATLSGNGRVAYAVTGAGRLVKVAVDTGVAAQIIGRTPDVSSTGGAVDAGMFTTIGGHAFADQTYTAAAPLPLTLGGVTVTVDGRVVPLSRVTPNAIDALIPWDLGSSSPSTVVVSASSAQTPFEAPQSTLQVSRGVRAGALYRQDWSPLSDLTVHTAEVIHVFAVGLGAVSPDVPAGAAAPSSEPLARLAPPMSCTNAQVLYAGLQPGTIVRVYQVDLQIGSTTGYQVFSCSTGGTSFAFLTLNVVP